jgi:hypothetical protein
VTRRDPPVPRCRTDISFRGEATPIVMSALTRMHLRTINGVEASQGIWLRYAGLLRLPEVILKTAFQG